MLDAVFSFLFELVFFRIGKCILKLFKLKSLYYNDNANPFLISLIGVSGFVFIIFLLKTIFYR